MPDLAPSPIPPGRRRDTRAGRLAVLGVVLGVVFGAALGTAAPSAAGASSDSSGRTVRPVTECVVVNGDGSFTAFFGYEHRGTEPVGMARGERNRIHGARADSPTTFAPGRHVAVFSATTRGPRVSWRLDGHEASATPESQPCSTNPTVPEAPVTVVLLLAPALITGWWMRRRERLVVG